MRHLPVLSGLLGATGRVSNRRRWIKVIVVGLLAAATGLYSIESARQTRQQHAAAGLVEARARAIAKAKAIALARAKSAAAAQPKTLVTSGRVVPSTQAADLFAPHSWYVAPPPPPPAAEEPPPAPTAPPLPYTYVGSIFLLVVIVLSTLMSATNLMVRSCSRKSKGVNSCSTTCRSTSGRPCRPESSSEIFRIVFSPSSVGFGVGRLCRGLTPPGGCIGC